MTGIVTLTLRPNKSSFMPRHTIIGKDIAYVKPLDKTLPLRPIEIEFENNRCCMEVHNTSDSTVEFLYGQEVEENYNYESPNNYYHNTSNQSRGHRPYNGQSGNRQFRGFIP